MYLPDAVVMGIKWNKAAQNNAWEIMGAQLMFATVILFLICYFKSSKNLETG